MTQQTLPTNPYVGPRAFEETEGDRFFGREREVAKLLNLLIARRLVLFHAPSGAGKTSLVQARLMPRLRAEGFFVHRPIRVNARPPLANDGTVPNRYLFATLATLNDEVAPELQRTPDELAQLSLNDYLATRRDVVEQDMVLIFDQFEELLTIDPTDREAKLAFLAQLGSALEAPHRWALFAIREDYLGALRPYLLPIPTRLAATYRLDLLTPNQALQAIQAPAQLGGGDFSTAAAQRLVDDLRQTTVQRPDGTSETILGNAIEPVQLQVVCFRLWERKSASAGSGQQEAGSVSAQEPEGDPSSQTILPPSHTTWERGPGAEDYPAPPAIQSIHIDLTDLEAAGSVDEALASYYAERVAAAGQVATTNERSVRAWLEQELISSDGMRGQVLRQAETTAGMPNAAIQVLVDAHLLRAEERRGAIWYELAHDRLIVPVRNSNAAWRKANLSPLQRQADLWASQRRAEGLLLRGTALRQAEAESEALNEVERDFLAACRKARDAAKVKQILSTAAMVGFVLALILAGVAWVQTGVATRESSMARTAEADAANQLRITNAHYLAFITQSLPVEPALQLAYEAYAIDQNIATESILRERINQHPWQVTSLVDHTEGVNNAIFSPDGTRILTSSDDRTARLWGLDGQPLATLMGHTDAVISAGFSPDGQRIITASKDGIVLLWNANGQRLATLVGHMGWVNSAVFSPDGTRILTASADRTARLWDVEGQLLATLVGHVGWVNSAIFLPDGQRILTISSDSTARLWDTDGQPLAMLMGHTDTVVSAVFSPDGTHILTASHDGTARLWDAEGQPHATLTGHTDKLNSAVFSPDGTHILTTSQDGSARLWDMEGQPHATLTGHTDKLNSAVFSPDGRRILTVSFDRTAQIWDADGQHLATLVGHMGWINSAIFSPDGTRILTTSADRTARLWQAVEQPLATLEGHTDAVSSAVFSPDGSRILTASSDGTARLWDANGQPFATIEGHTEAVSSAVFSPDGSRILTASWDGTARLWDTNGQPLATIEGHTNAFWSARFSPDGSRILTKSSDGTARLWDTSGQSLARLEGHTDAIWSARFSPDGARILTASRDGTARLWWANGQHLAMLESDTVTNLYNAIFSPDGTHILVGSLNGTAGLWDADGQFLTMLEKRTSSTISVAFSPDSSHILTASWDGKAYLWNTHGQYLTTLVGHTDTVWHALFSPDGSRIVTASEDGTARLWDAQGKPLATLTGHSGPVRSVVFSPDGRRILTASTDGTARQYFVAPEDLLATAACRIGRPLTQQEIERYNVPLPLHLNLEQRRCDTN
ncbi:NACHT and WD repeat domain-containing protein [Candidatus Viridilinea mediisalina]|uniref:Novel STAND NTPase 1 domain-containing protein n=1 Tax=Candidatus Viridilinea mediisalina TaxID=2024553 RepID=A0A2A6RKM0_9CHLR|nr:AAA family ATPase [Candidatus Viridilinea mediisalina]PDW03664.1 hypothetical protein CJ255_07505 [Candidatus Viridilinea mediisalina]